MSQITLDQLDIIDRLRAAEEACQEVEELIGYKVSEWSTGRAEGACLERAKDAAESISRLIIGLQVRLNWDISDNRPDDYSPEVLAEQDQSGEEL